MFVAEERAAAKEESIWSPMFVALLLTNFLTRLGKLLRELFCLCSRVILEQPRALLVL